MRRLAESTGIVLMVVVALLIFGLILYTPSRDSGSSQSGTIISSQGEAYTLILDGVELSISSPLIRNKIITVPDQNDPFQVAAFVQREPSFQEFTISAIPYGTRLPSEIFPILENDGPTLIKEMLTDHWEKQGGTVQKGPIASLFGQEVSSTKSIVDVFLTVDKTTTTQIYEWAVEAGDRVWLLRFSQEVDSAGGIEEQIQKDKKGDKLVNLEIISENLDSPSSILNNKLTELKSPSTDSITPGGDLPTPSWWDGECDRNYYYSQTGIYSYPLDGSHRGVQACGPRPWVDDVDDVLVRFYPGAWGEFEFQCVELCMRFMYLAYDIKPYQANGNQVVPHYSGDQLVKVNNGTTGVVPTPNDIISAGPTSTYGHSVVVKESDVDDEGNGTVTVIEQNSSASGIRIYPVTNWNVQSSTTVMGWLHNPNDDTNDIPFPWLQAIIEFITNLINHFRDLFMGIINTP